MIAHPHSDDVTLDAVLAALADPQRRAILAQIAATPELICSLVAPELPRSTVSVHLRRLREAGLIVQTRQGQLIVNSLRGDGARDRFAALVDTIEAASAN